MWIYLLLALVSLAVLWRVLRSPEPPRNTLVLVGPSGAGKTALFNAITKQTHQTLTSQQVSRKELENRIIVDTPGHPKLESLALAEISRKAQQIVFMVDATNLKGAGPLLYRVLVAAEMNNVPVVIAANKYDLFSTVSIAKVRQVLAAEIGEIRESADKGLGDHAWLGNEGEFRFEDLAVDVEIESGSVKANKFDQWIQ